MQLSWLSKVQSPLQDALAPGNWVGRFLSFNSDSKTWLFPNATPQQASDAIVAVIKGLNSDQRADLCVPCCQITKATADHVHVRTWTKKEWLDVLDIKLSNGSVVNTVDGSKDSAPPAMAVAEASFYATGMLPTSIPLAPIFNVALFFFPFYSPGKDEMLQTLRLRVLEDLVRKNLASSAK